MNRGFTLMELLVTIAVLGLLAGIAVAGFLEKHAGLGGEARVDVDNPHMQPQPSRPRCMQGRSKVAKT